MTRMTTLLLDPPWLALVACGSCGWQSDPYDLASAYGYSLAQAASQGHDCNTTG